MSKLSEYISLLPKGIKNLPQIVEGVVNNTRIELGKMPPEDLEIVIKRRLICETCTHMSKNAVDYMSDLDEDHCIWCKCFIKYKTANLKENCGLEKYNKKYNKNEKLKWKSI